MNIDWDLQLAKFTLENSGKTEWQSYIEGEVLLLKTKIKNDDPTLTFKNIIKLDSQLNSVWAATELFSLHGSSVNLSVKNEDWLRTISEKFSNKISEFIHNLDDLGRPISSEMQAWVDSFTLPDMNLALVKIYRELFQKWNKKELSFFGALALRVKVDPDKKFLESRALTNNLSIEDLTFTSSYTLQSQQYFNEILSELEIEPTSIRRLRTIEANQFNCYSFSLAEALNLIGDSLGSLGNPYKEIFNDLLTFKRLRILQDQSGPDCCFDSPFGSYIQVYFDGSLVTLNRLVHEIGHAIHQSIHRKSSFHFIPLTDVTSETWAMSFENYFMQWFCRKSPRMKHCIEKFVKFQRIEMNQRHQMLHEFELAICNRNISSISEVNSVWTNINQIFFGSNVVIDTEFETAWMGIHHLISAPFYLSTYSFAKNQADNIHFTDLINEYKKKD